MQCTIGYIQIKGVSVMETINIHLNEEDARFIKEYVEAKQLDLSIFIRDVMIEHIQNERDLNRFHETMYHHQKASKAISFEEMMKGDLVLDQALSLVNA